MTTATSRQNREREAEGVPVIAVAATGDETRRRSRAAGEDASSASAVSPGWPHFRPPLPFAFAAFLLGCACSPSLSSLLSPTRLPLLPSPPLPSSPLGRRPLRGLAPDVHNAARLQIKVTHHIPRTPAFFLASVFRGRSILFGRERLDFLAFLSSSDLPHRVCLSVEISTARAISAARARAIAPSPSRCRFGPHKMLEFSIVTAAPSRFFHFV